MTLSCPLLLLHWVHSTVLLHRVGQNSSFQLWKIQTVGCLAVDTHLVVFAVDTVDTEWAHSGMNIVLHLVGCLCSEWLASVKVAPPRTSLPSRFRPESWDPLHSTVCLFLLPPCKSYQLPCTALLAPVFTKNQLELYVPCSNSCRCAISRKPQQCNTPNL